MPNVLADPVLLRERLRKFFLLLLTTFLTVRIWLKLFIGVGLGIIRVL